jgi:hypothetical protein
MEMMNIMVKEFCSAMPKMLTGCFGPGLIGTFTEPFLGKAPCGVFFEWCSPTKWAEALAILMGK